MGMTWQIKELLYRKGMTQKDLAAKLGISQPAISKRFIFDNWREDDLRQIAEICGCKYKSYFLTEDGEEI